MWICPDDNYMAYPACTVIATSSSGTTWNCPDWSTDKYHIFGEILIFPSKVGIQNDHDETAMDGQRASETPSGLFWGMMAIFFVPIAYGFARRVNVL